MEDMEAAADLAVAEVVAAAVVVDTVAAEAAVAMVVDEITTEAAAAEAMAAVAITTVAAGADMGVISTLVEGKSPGCHCRLFAQVLPTCIVYE